MFVLCFHPSLDGGALMSADERPLRLEKGEPKDSSNRLALQTLQERRAGARP
jgi:hypothetical protein